LQIGDYLRRQKEDFINRVEIQEIGSSGNFFAGVYLNR